MTNSSKKGKAQQESFTREFKFEAFKEPWIYPCLEDWKVNEIYSFTISPRFQSSSYLEMYTHFIDHIQPLLKGSEYVLFPELSTKSTQYHWHGYIRIKKKYEIVRFYLNIPKFKSLSTFKIDTIGDNIVDSSIWYTYCHKQEYHLKSYILNTYKGTIPYEIDSGHTCPH